MWVVTPAQQSSVERIGAALAQAGLSRLPSRVFAALLVDDDGRMTSAEVAAALDISPAGVSGAVSYLEQLGMLRRERERGSRRDVYVVDDDAWHETMMRHDQIYGPIAFGTNARSTFLTDWPGGGYIGIHGTNAPELLPGRVSHGCVRMRNEDILALSRLMPVGTPVTIR